jgi:hypothetical protein
MSPSDRVSKVRHGLTRAEFRSQLVVAASALLVATVGSSAFGQSEPLKPAQVRTVEVEKIFTDDRGAQRMTRVGGDPLSLAGSIADQMPDWAEWWSTEEVMLSLGIPKERAAAVEALLDVRKRARIDAIKASETSEAGVKFGEAARAAGADDPAAKPPLEMRAVLARLASRAASVAFEALMSADGDFAAGCARLVMPAGQPEPDAELRERMRLGVARLRGLDPALSRMKLVNTGVELAIHAAPLLEQAGDSRQAIADEIAAWRQAVAPLLDAFERQRAETVAASASDQSLEQKIRRRSGLGDRARTIHADLVTATVRSARGIAAIVGASDPDRSNAWLRSAYHALSPMNLGATCGDAALEEALQIAADSGDEGREWSAALALIRTENLRACVQLEGALIDACVRAIRVRDSMTEVMMQAGPVFEINTRRSAQSDAVVARAKSVVPSALHAGIDRACTSARNRIHHLIPRP